MAQHFLTGSAVRGFSLVQVDAMTEADALQFLARARWSALGEGVQACPRCGVIRKHHFKRTRRQWVCVEPACGHTFSVTSGTVLADRKMTYKQLVKAVVLFTTNVKGIAAAAMARMIGVSYKSAFTLLHKLREALLTHRDASPLGEHAQMDGGHFSGKRRKPRKRKSRKAPQARTKISHSAPTLHPNRRIVMVMREVYPKDSPDGKGAKRTIVSVAMTEGPTEAMTLAKRYIKPGSVVWTDEHPAYGSFAALFDHDVVNHSEELATDAGVNNNQAESFFTRARRFVLGQIHRITPKYMMDYANEMAWREDNRRRTTEQLVTDLLRKALAPGESNWWRRYWQGHRRGGEILMA